MTRNFFSKFLKRDWVFRTSVIKIIYFQDDTSSCSSFQSQIDVANNIYTPAGASSTEIGLCQIGQSDKRGILMVKNDGTWGSAGVSYVSKWFNRYIETPQIKFAVIFSIRSMQNQLAIRLDTAVSTISDESIWTVNGQKMKSRWIISVAMITMFFSHVLSQVRISYYYNILLSGHNEHLIIQCITYTV